MEEKVYLLFKSLILFAKVQTCSYLPWSLQTNYTSDCIIVPGQSALYKLSPYLYLNQYRYNYRYRRYFSMYRYP